MKPSSTSTARLLRNRRGCELDAVLGLSMTPTAIGLVLVEGQAADGDIMDQDAFEIPTRRGAAALSTSEYVARALTRTRTMAGARRPHAVGVTWSDDSAQQASLLLTSLSEAGFDNVVAVGSPEAGEALARGIGRTLGYPHTALCLMEPDATLVSMVATDDGAIETAGGDGWHDTDQLIEWLTQVFDDRGWAPGCVILLGQGNDLNALAAELERHLGLPVFAPAEAELALARGAALASAQDVVGVVGETDGDHAASPARAGRTSDRSYRVGLAMLGVGVVTFVVSVSLVVGMQLTSNSATPAAPAQRPAAVQPAPPPIAPVAVRPVVPPPVEVVAPLPEPAPVPESLAPIVVANAEAQLRPTEAVPGELPAPPVEGVPPAEAPPVPPVPGRKPPLLTRILGHMPGLFRDPAQPPAGVPPGPPPGPEAPAPLPSP